MAGALRRCDLSRSGTPKNDFVQPWVQGYSKQLYTNYWKYLDIDLARRK